MKKILIANRGEIATRIIRAVHELGMQAIAIYAKADEFSMHRFKADEAYEVGVGEDPIAAYLDIDDIVRIAKEHEVDAIHPGYGFLSENADFARAVLAAGIKFVGPTPAHLEMFGDKIKAKNAAIAAGVPTVPGTDHPVTEISEAIEFGQASGYPLFVKSAAGGGGRGMRVVHEESELVEAFARARSEAEKSFGDDEIYLERYLVDPKHIEVQIIADEHGQVVHLFERNSSVQRRHQKIVEFAPAVGVSTDVRRRLQAAAVALLESVDYQNAATVEFLVEGEDFFFIEVNPRVQVEHTVTEEVTGIDIVKTQILIAAGQHLHTEIGVPEQADIRATGVAIQARITTEDPMNGFVPDTGRIQTYRSPGGTGVRLDAGNAFTGAYVTPYYDSLLTKAIVHGMDFEAANQKLRRVLDEFIIRGVKTNIPFLKNLVNHPVFRSGQAPTTFVDETPALFDLQPEPQPTTKLIHYVATTTVNGFPGVDSDETKYYAPNTFKADFAELPTDLVTAKTVLDEQGAAAMTQWLMAQKQVLLTDTTMRDAHQSLFATRMRTKDMVNIAGDMQKAMPNLFSAEVWGGATFDVAYRFLGEDPWERLRQLRKLMPKTLLQMLFRGSNAVGYQNYPDNVIQEFIKASAENGVDVFRIFDSLNWVPQMTESIKAVRDTGKLAEAAMAYTGDILDPHKTKYTTQYYVDLAKELEASGAHIIGIKDMAGLLKPQAAYELVSTLKATIEIPIHLHTHDTTGNGIFTYARAVEAGVDVVDVASSAMSGTTSQPSTTALYYALSGNERQPDLAVQKAEKIDEYWGTIRPYYAGFGNKLNGAQTDIYQTEMPGGQYSNLQQQANALRLGDRWDEIKVMYTTVNEMFGDISKVTPSSKVVGDMALFMVQNDLSAADIYEHGETLDFPESVVSFFMGDLGQPVGGFPKDLQKIILKGKQPLTVRPGALAKPVDFAAVTSEVATLIGHAPSREEVLSYIMYPKVYADYIARQNEFGPMTYLDTPTFFQGMRIGERVEIETTKGRKNIVVLRQITEPNPDGTRSLFFEVNGQSEEIIVQDVNANVSTTTKQKAEPTDPEQIGATMAGSVVSVLVTQGQQVKQGDSLIVTEAMKMETIIQAPYDAEIRYIHATNGMQIDGGDLLLELTKN